MQHDNTKESPKMGMLLRISELWGMLSGSGLRNRIIYAAIFALCTVLYVWLLVPATRTSDIIYPGVSIDMRTVAASGVFETALEPGQTVSQTVEGNGERMDALAVQLSFSGSDSADVYRITVLDPAGSPIAVDEFTTAGRTSPFEELIPLGGIEMRVGEDYQFVLSSPASNENTILVPSIPFGDWYSYPSLTKDGTAEDEVLLLSLIAQVDQGPAWALAWIMIAAVCTAIMFWRAPLAVNSLVMILIFGLIFCFCTPINDSPDEVAHMARTFRMTEGEFFSVRQADEAVSDLYSGSSGQMVWDTALADMPWDSKPELGNAGADLLPADHIPQAAGVLIARAIGLDVAGIYYAGRLFNLLFYSMCAYFAVRMAPRFRLYLAVFAIMPMQIAVCSTYSSDGCIYGLTILAAGWFIRMYYNSSAKIGHGALAVFAGLMALICLKIYWAAPLGFLPLAIPAGRFTRRSVKMYCIAGAVCAAAAAAAGLWYSETYGLSGVAGTVMQDADTMGQMQFMLSYPVKSARIIAGSLASGLGSNLAELFVFGRLTVRTPALIVMLYIAFLAVTAFSTTRYQHDAAYTVGNTAVRTGTRTWVICIMLATVIAIYVGNYLTWTPVGMDTVVGVQGRYMIPVLAYLPFLSFDAWPLVTRSVYMRSRTVSGLIGVLMLMASVMSLCFYAL